MVEPFLVRKIDNVEVAVKKLRRLPISSHSIDVVKEGLREVVDNPRGTGHRAKTSTAMAGKAGTAQVEGKEPHGWFVGFAPYENPKVSFVIFLEHGGSGGALPARIAKDLVQYLKRQNL